MEADLNNPIFHDTEKARTYLERNRWPDGAVCPHCGVTGPAITRVEGKKRTHRPGLYHCNGCAMQFTVTVGTVYESSHIPLHKWLFATHLMTSSKKGISAHQLHRMLGITYKSAWFMAHRIREGMINQNPGHKLAIMSLVERGGAVRSFHLKDVNGKSMANVLANVSRAAHLRTDELAAYVGMGWNFASHKTVNHSAKEYVRGDAYTNTIEGFFSIFKRGMRGVYQHCGEQHLQRYLTEFDFRYTHRAKLGVTDAQRADLALKGIEGKRLTYRRTDRPTH